MCSYCGCRANTLIARYSLEHDEIVNAVGDLRRAVQGHGAESVTDAASRMVALLTPHTASEERSLFAALRRDAEFTAHVDGLCAEHEELDGLLAAIADGRADQLAIFESRLRQHIDKEENGLFPASVISLDGPSWDEVVALDATG